MIGADAGAAWDVVKMHLPYESRGRRRREMADLEPWWMQSIIEETRAEHPDLGKLLIICIVKTISIDWNIKTYERNTYERKHAL